MHLDLDFPLPMGRPPLASSPATRRLSIPRGDHWLGVSRRFTLQADAIIEKASEQEPVLLDWQQNGARLVLFDLGSSKRN